MSRQFIVSVGLAAAVLLAGCGSAEPTPSSAGAANPTVAAPTTQAALTPTVEPTTASEPTASSEATETAEPTAAATTTTESGADATPSADGEAVGEDDLKLVADAWNNVTSVRANVALTAPEIGVTEAVVEIVPPDSQRVTATIQGQEVEFVNVAGDVYINVGGQWTHLTGELGVPNDLLSDNNPADAVTQLQKQLADGATATKGEITTIDGVECQEWTITTSESSGTLCVGVDDHLPHRFESADGSATITFYDWNADITIEPPL